jgi:hypothetical protein
LSESRHSWFGLQLANLPQLHNIVQHCATLCKCQKEFCENTDEELHEVKCVDLLAGMVIHWNDDTRQSIITYEIHLHTSSITLPIRMESFLCNHSFFCSFIPELKRVAKHSLPWCLRFLHQNSTSSMVLVCFANSHRTMNAPVSSSL